MPVGKAKRLGRCILGPLLGRPRFQPLFQSIHDVALAGMGYGEGANPAASGERLVLEYIKKRLPARDRVTVFDVGANVGQYSEEVLGIWGDCVDLWCFEPSPSTFEVLSQKLGGRAGVTLENIGLSDSDAALTLHTLGQGSKVASVYDRRTGRWELGQSEQIQVRSLDSFCEERGVTAIDYLKVDVEGHELSVMQGASSMLASGAIRFLQFEFSAACIDARVFFRDYWDILSPDYDLYRVLAHGLVAVPTYTETSEVFKRATNYLAQRRRPS